MALFFDHMNVVTSFFRSPYELEKPRILTHPGLFDHMNYVVSVHEYYIFLAENCQQL